jgi:hypothetical protein
MIGILIGQVQNNSFKQCVTSLLESLKLILISDVLIFGRDHHTAARKPVMVHGNLVCTCFELQVTSFLLQIVASNPVLMSHVCFSFEMHLVFIIDTSYACDVIFHFI